MVANRFDRLDETLAGAMAHTFGPAEGLRACCPHMPVRPRYPGHYQVLFSANLALDPARPGDRPGERVFGAW